METTNKWETLVWSFSLELGEVAGAVVLAVPRARFPETELVLGTPALQ